MLVFQKMILVMLRKGMRYVREWMDENCKLVMAEEKSATIFSDFSKFLASRLGENPGTKQMHFGRIGSCSKNQSNYP